MESGKVSPTGWNSLSYDLSDSQISRSYFTLLAILSFPRLCLRDAMWRSITLFFTANSSLQAQQNSLLLLTVKCSSGYALTWSDGNTVFRSAATFPFPFRDLRGGLHLISLFQAKSDGWGQRRWSRRDEVVEVSEPVVGTALVDSLASWSSSSSSGSLSLPVSIMRTCLRYTCACAVMNFELENYVLFSHNSRILFDTYYS